MPNRIYAFDVLKLLGAIGIALLHFNWKLIPQGYLFVEMFFILSGYLLYSNISRYKEQNWVSILIKRLKSFYVLYIFVLLGQILLNSKPSLPNFISALFLLGDIGLGDRFSYGALWFLGVYIYCFMFYILLFKTLQEKQALLITAVIVLICLFSFYTFSAYHALNKTYEMTIGPFQFGLMRGLAGIGWGICLHALTPKNYHLNQLLVNVVFILLSGLFVFYIFHKVTPAYDFINYLVISGIIFLINSKKGCINILLQSLGRKFHYVCSLSLPIYIFHCLVIDILNKLNTSSQGYSPVLYMLWVVLMAVVMERIQKLILKEYHNISKREMHD